MSQVLVEVSGMSKRYGRVTALDNVAFSIRSGELLGLIGPNGAGKTTLFECLAGVQPADHAQVLFQAEYRDTRRRSSVLFYVPDGIAPWPSQPVQRALEFSLDFLGGPRPLYKEVIADLSLGPLLRVPIGNLSKGQRKRALLGLGLLSPQPVLLIDEPFEGLDLRQTREATDALRKHVLTGRSLFVSIHQISAAAKVCDRLVLLSEGRVVAQGTPDELTRLAAQKLGHTPPSDFEEVFLALTG
ncbi:MAG: ABC transporter ATP-binding protein [Acidobacteriia bacterium]|nr:ABC transporter ATP-binding protein [Terriglobia bacterium]